MQRALLAVRLLSGLIAAPAGLAGFILDQFTLMRRHRDNTASGWSMRLLQAMRAFNGVYEEDVVQEIKRFGGSSIYARIIAQKCRGTTSLLRDVYIGPDRPWSLEPPSDPAVPPEVVQAIQQLMEGEVGQMIQQYEQLSHMQAAHMQGVAAAHAFRGANWADSRSSAWGVARSAAPSP